MRLLSLKFEYFRMTRLNSNSVSGFDDSHIGQTRLARHITAQESCDMACNFRIRQSNNGRWTKENNQAWCCIQFDWTANIPYKKSLWYLTSLWVCRGDFDIWKGTGQIFTSGPPARRQQHDNSITPRAMGRHSTTSEVEYVLWMMERFASGRLIQLKRCCVDVCKENSRVEKLRPKVESNWLRCEYTATLNCRIKEFTKYLYSKLMKKNITSKR